MDKQLHMADEAFKDLMERIDQELSANGAPIPNRPILALGLISKDYPVQIPITEPPPGAREPLRQNWSFSAKVYEWYRHRYGERLKKHWGPGRMVILIRNDPWILRLPRILGRVNAVASRTAVTEGIGIHGKTLVYNVLDSVENLTAGMKESLTDQELENIFRLFQMGYATFMILERLYSNRLVESALSDLDAAVRHIMVPNPNYNLSKWSSHQAVEKILKVSIAMRGGSFSKIHNLKALSDEAAKNGINTPSQNLLSTVQCSPAIRYDSQTTTLLGAVDAHHASIEICFVITEQVLKTNA